MQAGRRKGGRRVSDPRTTSTELEDRPGDSVLVPGLTCWRTAHADRFTPIVDGADYLFHVKAAMLRAERRIILIGWDLDYRTAFEQGTPRLAGPNHLGLFLHWLLWDRG